MPQRGQPHSKTNHENSSAGYTWEPRDREPLASRMWSGVKGEKVRLLECFRKKVVGEPYEGKPHVRFEAAGDGNQD
jgi:hypothetical protein